jgi:hypothetical protein
MVGRDGAVPGGVALAHRGRRPWAGRSVRGRGGGGLACAGLLAVRAAGGGRMRIAILAALAASLVGCTVPLTPWPAEIIPVALQPAAAPGGAENAPQRLIDAPARRKYADCPPIDATVTAEAVRITSLDVARTGGIDALTAALMRSEAEKNARLRQVVAAFEQCRQAK